MNSKKRYPIFIFILLFIGMFLFPYIPLELFHINLDNLNDKMKIMYQLSCDIGYMLIVFMLYRSILVKNFKKYIKDFKKIFKLSITYYAIGLVIMIISNGIIGLFFSEATPHNEEAVRDLISLYPGYMVFSTAIYAPYIEEIIFRKSMRDCFLTFDKKKIITYIYIAVSGIIFALLHVIGSVTNPLDYLYVIPYMGLGCAFAALYDKTDNIFSTIVLHSMHNAVAIIIYLVAGV